MNPEQNAEHIGQTLATESVGSVVRKAEEYCAYEEKRSCSPWRPLCFLCWRLNPFA